MEETKRDKETERERHVLIKGTGRDNRHSTADTATGGDSRALQKINKRRPTYNNIM